MGTYLTATGFRVKRQDEITTELEAKFKSIYGGQVNLSPQSVNGQEIATFSESLADMWNILEALYHSFSVGGARGRVQEAVYELNGLTRNQAASSTVTLLFTGEPGTIILAGTEVESIDKLIFKTTQIGTINQLRQASIPAESELKGPYPAPPGSINTLVNPNVDIESVTNLQAAVPGRYRETDAEFRYRRDLSTAIPGLNTLESLFSKLSDLEGVNVIKIEENKTNDPYLGMPPHSFSVIIEGGVDEEIAKLIWISKPAGIVTYGSIPIDVIDNQGKPNTVYFSRPEDVTIYMQIDITTDPELYPSDGDDLIKEAIIDYVSGALEETTNFAGFGIGKDVILSKLYVPINLVQGHEIESILIGTDPLALSNVNIPIAWNKKGLFLSENIEII